MSSIFDDPGFTSRLFFPSGIVSATPPGARDLSIEVPGAQLHLRWHAAPGARATVLLFHGNGEVVADYDHLASSYARAGLCLAVVDFRGYGASTGSPTLRNAIEDAPRVTRAFLERSPGPVIVMGRSLGSACAAEVYRRSDASGPSAVVIESGFSSLLALIRRRGLTPPPALSAEELDLFDPRPKLARPGVPLLVIHGEDDALISAGEGEALFEAAATPDKRLVLIPGRGHNDLSGAAEYWDALRTLGAQVASRPA